MGRTSPATTAALPVTDLLGLPERLRAVRRQTERLCESLEIEDYGLQSMPEASPVKWHLAHVTWFFETFALSPYLPGYKPFHPAFRYLFNSYYNAVGPRWPRPQRGLLSRPTVAEVCRYRAYVDDALARLLGAAWADVPAEVAGVVELGLHHEQQHQELIVTDLKHALMANPLDPVYREWPVLVGQPLPAGWRTFPEDLVQIGKEGTGFAFDNETPRHRVFVPAFRLATRLATNDAYLVFMADRGYERPELWLSDGWAARQAQGWTAPLYWEQEGDQWYTRTLAGRQALDPAEPVCHVSYHEADAFARWCHARLPTEAEWETAAATVPLAGHFLEAGRCHPAPAPAADDDGPFFQLFGDVWQWTASPYVGYPGNRPAAGALGEYNAKFTCNQFVLRGASCATPRSHARATYRNFFPPDARWQFTGVRLAEDL